jgi:hypothetical protein
MCSQHAAGAASDDDSDIVTRRGVVLYDFAAEEADEVAIAKGESLDVAYEVGGWLQVRSNAYADCVVPSADCLVPYADRGLPYGDCVLPCAECVLPCARRRWLFVQGG